MEKKQLVIGLGEALFDVLPEGKKLGGAPANFAYHVSQFGLESCAVSAMGDDELGKELEKELNDHHLNYQIDKVAYPTGTVQVSLDANGIPCYDIKEGAAWDNIPYTPALEKLAKNCTAACFGSLAQRNEVSRNTIYRFLDHMPKEEGILKIFDINLRQGFYTKEIITESIKRCNILTCASLTLLPFRILATNAPVNESPAPTVSATSTFGVSINETSPGVNT